MKKTLGGLMVALCLCLAGCAAHGQHTSQPVSASQSTPPTLGQHTASAAVPAQSDDASEGADASSADSTEPLPPTEDAQQPTSQKETTEKATKPATKNDKTTTKDSTSQPAEPKQDTTAPVMTGYLPRGDVIQIALRHAGLKQADICDLSCKLEDEDGVMIYQVEFEHGKYEYEYDIDAKSGKILDVEIDD